MARSRIQSEQVYVVAVAPNGDFVIGGDTYRHVPWHLLRSCHLYALDEESLRIVLDDASDGGWHVFDGSSSDRRGIGGFSVGIGPWGVRGVIECRRVDSWAVRIPDGDQVSVSGVVQRRLRAMADRLNDEEVGFRPTALRFLRAAYEWIGRPNEPSEVFPPPLEPDVAALCRRAHVGGPIVHARTSLRPYTTIDRRRAYGESMLEVLPSGRPVEVQLRGDGLQRWSEHSLMSSVGFADATVRVECGPLVPLLPVLKWHSRFDRAKALYPTGSFRGAFCLSELAFMEQRGLGRVEQLHRVLTFERAAPLAPVVRYLRRAETWPEVGPAVSVKRLEHMLYGWCSRTLSFSRFGSATRWREPVLQDLVDLSTLERLTTRVELRRIGSEGKDAALRASSGLPLYEVRGSLSERAGSGTMDRPDRSAWIVASNRIAVAELLLSVDAAPGSDRPGSRVGRVYVDGVDVEGRPEDLTIPEGWEVRDAGQEMRILRPNVYWKRHDDGRIEIEDGGLLGGGTRDVERLEQAVRSSPDLDGGAFASGRWWPEVPGADDPRMEPDQVSEPVDLEPGTFESFRWEVEYD